MKVFNISPNLGDGGGRGRGGGGGVVNHEDPTPNSTALCNKQRGIKIDENLVKNIRRACVSDVYVYLFSRPSIVSL